MTGRVEGLRRDVDGCPTPPTCRVPGRGDRGPVRPPGARVRLSAVEPAGPGDGGPAVRRVRPRRPHRAQHRRARPGEGVLHQPGHRGARCQLRRFHRLRPRLPRTAAPPSGAWSTSRTRSPRPSGWRGRVWPIRNGSRSGAAGAGGWTVMAACCASSGVRRRRLLLRGELAPPPVRRDHPRFRVPLHRRGWSAPPIPPCTATPTALGQVAGVTCPMLLLQGLSDPVVPRRPVPEPSPTPSPNAVSPAPTSPSRARPTASAEPRPAARPWPPSSPSTSRYLPPRAELS